MSYVDGFVLAVPRKNLAAELASKPDQSQRIK